MQPLSPKTFRRIKSVITLKDCSLGVNDDGRGLLTWWYSGFYKNKLDSSQPHILVLFRRISTHGILGEIVQRRVPLVALGQVRVGTIWRNDHCKTEIDFKISEFNVSFRPDQWRFTSFGDAMRRSLPPPYPMEIHPLLRDYDKNWLVEFKLPGGGRLLVPSIEFFSRCYGRSAELKRVLATYRWDGPGDSAMSRLYAPLEAPEEAGCWQVRLRKKLHNGDAVFLAHAKYDGYTKHVAKGIHAELEANYDPNLRNPAFVKIGPWHQGPAILKVEGLPFDGGKSFLCLRVRGMSNPEGNVILRSRENSRDADNPAPEGSPEAWAGAPERALLKYPETVDLTGDTTPDHEAGAVEIHDPDFEVLGPARPVIDVRPEQAKTKGGLGKGPSDVPAISGGEASGSGKGVGYASIHARPVFESHGTLRDMWDAMVSLQRTQPEVVHSVSWYTFADGFQTGPTPSLIALEPFKESDEVPAEVRRFPYMDPSIPSLRGILVVRLMTPEGPAYIVEIMRRPRKIADDNGKVKETEEPFQGLVFRLDHEKLLAPWLRTVASRIRHEKGVFKRLTGACPGTADSFSHRFSNSANADRLPCESIVLGALSKLNALSKA